MEVSLDCTVAAGPHVLSCNLGEDAALLDSERGIYYGLNATGARIWALIQQPTPVAAVLDRIASEYSVARDVCEADVTALVGRLADSGLVRLERPDGHAPSTRDRG